jgi:hypothetical protein
MGRERPEEIDEDIGKAEIMKDEVLTKEIKLHHSAFILSLRHLVVVPLVAFPSAE